MFFYHKKSKPEHLLVLDFDRTITDWDDQLSKTRADKIAKILKRILKKYPVKLVLLSWANRSHILYVVAQSKSVSLMKLIKDNLMLTEENQNILYKFFKNMNPFHRKTQRQKTNIILQVMKDPKYTNDQSCLRASKKTVSLKWLSSTHQIPPENIFFLDDNWHNVRFAKHFGFVSYRVLNEKSSKTIFDFLDKVEQKLEDLSPTEMQKVEFDILQHPFSIHHSNRRLKTIKQQV